MNALLVHRMTEQLIFGRAASSLIYATIPTTISPLPNPLFMTPMLFAR